MTLPEIVCVHCGGETQTVTNIQHMGEHWKTVLSCDICDMAAEGKDLVTAQRKFVEGQTTLAINSK